MRSPELGQNDPPEPIESVADVEPKAVIPQQEGEFSAEKRLETEEKEFLNGLLVPDMNDFRREICDTFGTDERHAPPFLTCLVLSLNSEQLQELKEITGDYNFSTGCYALRDMVKDMTSVYQNGENPAEESIKINPYRQDPYFDIRENFSTYAKIVKLFTGKEFDAPNFIPEKAEASALKGNEQLGRYIEQVKNFWDNLIEERAHKYESEFQGVFGKDTDIKTWLYKKNEDFDSITRDDIGEYPHTGTLSYVREERKARLKRYDFFEEIKKSCQERLGQFAKSSPLKGKRVFEIGGTALKQTLGQAGAESVYFDATGFDWEKWGRSAETTRISNTMNSKNCQAILDKIDPGHPEHQFDLTTSREVLDYGSGIENTVTSGDIEAAVEEVLKVLAMTTKAGGLSIHQVGFSNGDLFGRDEKARLKEIGFEKIFILSGRDNYRLRNHPFFVKREKNSPDGISMDFEEPTVVLRKK